MIKILMITFLKLSNLWEFNANSTLSAFFENKHTLYESFILRYLVPYSQFIYHLNHLVLCKFRFHFEPFTQYNCISNFNFN